MTRVAAKAQLFGNSTEAWTAINQLLAGNAGFRFTVRRANRGSREGGAPAAAGLYWRCGCGIIAEYFRLWSRGFARIERIDATVPRPIPTLGWFTKVIP
jgi:hypothetical protein